MIEFSTVPFRVRYSETDQMGFVHHSNYLKYFEMARIEWLNSIGYSYKKLEEEGIVMPVLTADLKFKKPCFFDDLLTVHLFINEIPKTRIFFKYMITNQLKNKVAYGNTSLAFLDTKKRIPIRCPKIFIDSIQSLL